MQNALNIFQNLSNFERHQNEAYLMWESKWLVCNCFYPKEARPFSLCLLSETILDSRAQHQEHNRLLRHRHLKRKGRQVKQT